MGSSPSTHDHKHLDVRALSLRAPIFHKSPREKCDFKANSKYCNEEIVKQIFQNLDLNGDNNISFEEFKTSPLARQMGEVRALAAFKEVDVDNNGMLDYNEFRNSKLHMHLGDSSG
jgi:hypothetical protein